MVKLMSWIKVFFINIILIFALLGMLLLAPPIIVNSYNILKTKNNPIEINNKSSLELYSKYDWAEKFFKEFSEIGSNYYDYITWRLNDYSGDTININEGLRKTNNSKNSINKSQQFWFYGGSTTWGYGVNDKFTYPSLFANATNSYVINFGGTGYIARQSLAYLNNYLVTNNLKDMSGIHVIFYDGVNDIATRCRSETKSISTERQRQLRAQLRTKDSEPFSFKRTFSQLQEFLNGLMRFVNSEVSLKDPKKMYNCVSDKKRAQEIATTLVSTWEATSDLVKSRGGEFTAILQPVAYYSDANVDYLNLQNLNSKNMSEQYNVVYPMILKAVAKSNIQFRDLTKVYDKCNNCYIDFCHVGPQGHQILTAKLVSELID